MHASSDWDSSSFSWTTTKTKCHRRRHHHHRTECHNMEICFSFPPPNLWIKEVPHKRWRIPTVVAFALGLVSSHPASSLFRSPETSLPNDTVPIQRSEELLPPPSEASMTSHCSGATAGQSIPPPPLTYPQLTLITYLTTFQTHSTSKYHASPSHPHPKSISSFKHVWRCL